MNSDEKNKIDSLEILRKAAWDTYQSRINFEWKISISLWTAIATFIGVVLTNSLEAKSDLLIYFVGLVEILIIVLHYLFIRGVAKAHYADRCLEFYYRDQMWILIKIMIPEGLNDLLIERKRVKKDGSIFSWSYIFQLGITIVLLLTVLLVFLIH